MPFPIQLPTKVIYAGKHTILLQVLFYDDADQPDPMLGWTQWRAVWRPCRNDEDNGIDLTVTRTGNELTVEVDEPTSLAIGNRGGVWDVKATSPEGKREAFYTADTAAKRDVTRP